MSVRDCVCSAFIWAWRAISSWSSRDWSTAIAEALFWCCDLRLQHKCIFGIEKTNQTTKQKGMVFFLNFYTPHFIPFILTSGSNSCRDVNYPHSTLSRINMLAASTSSTKSLNTEIRFIDLYTGWSITHDWNYSNSSKWSMAALVTVKRGDTYQPVHSYLCFGISKSIITIHFDCCPLKERNDLKPKTISINNNAYPLFNSSIGRLLGVSVANFL